MRTTPTRRRAYGHALFLLVAVLLGAPSSQATTDLCSDGVQDGTESDVDCGGQCPLACDDGKHCVYDTDCRHNYCDPSHLCAVPSVLDENCTNDGTNVTLYSPGWPYHEVGTCADGYDPFTIFDAARLCPGGVVKYF